MGRRRIAAVGLACTVALVLSACGSDDESGGGDGGDSSSGGGGTLDIGVMASLSGAAGASAGGVTDGLNARLQAYEADNGECADSVDFNIIEQDDQSSPQGALSGIQKLVQQDNVYAVIEESAFFYGASPWVTTQGSGTPVIGGAFDGAQEWLNIADNENLFPNFTVNDNTKIFTTTGDYLASQGATKVAGVAYNSPSSAAALEAGFVSAEAAGLSRGYANDSVAFGSSDVGPIVLGIIDSGADALQLTINPDTAFAIIAGLAQAGYPMKAIVSPTGYGAELLASAPAVQIAQGVTFTSSYAPVEVGTEAADYERQALMDYTDSESGVPGFFVSMGWFAGDLLLHGLELAGCDATQEEFIAALGDDDTWDAGGLYPNPIPMNAVGSDEQCLFAVKLTGNEFVPVEGASPLCGGRVDG